MADDVKFGVKFDEEALKKSGKKLKEQLEKMEKRLSRKRARNRLKKRREDKRNEERITRDQMREQAKRDRMEKTLSRKRARNRLKQKKARIREERRIEKEAERERERKKDRRRAIAGGAVRGAGRVVGGVAGVAGFSLASLFDPDEVLGFERSLAILAGQAKLTTEGQAELRESLTSVSLATGAFRTDVLRGFEAVVEKSGDLKLAEDIILSMSKASIGLGADLADLGDLGAALGTTFAGSGEDVNKFFNQLVAQGDAGEVTLKDLARIAGEVFGTARGAGFKGEGVVSSIGTLIQSAKAVGSADERKTAINNILLALATKEKDVKKTFGVDTKKGGKLRDPLTIIKEILKSKGGTTENLKKVFQGDVKALLLASSEFKDTGKFSTFDKFQAAASGANSLISKRFQRVEKTGSLAFDKFQNVITLLSESSLAPALTELSSSLTALLQDKEKVEALTELFKTLGEGLGFLIEAAALAGQGVGFFSKTSKELEEKTGIKPVNPLSPTFGIEAIKKAKEFFGGDDSKAPKGSTLPSGKQGGLKVEVNATIDDRGNVKKQRTRVSNQNNPNVGRTLTGAGR